MAGFDHALHQEAEVGAYIGIEVRRRCAACRSANPDGLLNCAVCGAECPREPVRLIQGRLTDGTLKWFHLARYALMLATWLNKVADWLEGKDGQV